MQLNLAYEETSSEIHFINRNSLKDRSIWNKEQTSKIKYHMEKHLS